MSKECTTHHLACDCRERRFAELESENAALRADLIEVKKAFAPIFVRELHDECIKLERENAALRAWIKEEGSRNDVCTYEILKEVCDDCKCGKRKEAQP